MTRIPPRSTQGTARVACRLKTLASFTEGAALLVGNGETLLVADKVVMVVCAVVVFEEVLVVKNRVVVLCEVSCTEWEETADAEGKDGDKKRGVDCNRGGIVLVIESEIR